MLYIKLTEREIKLFSLKKTLLGQYEVDFYEKKHETPLLEKGQAQNIDILASAIKEAVSNIADTQDREVYLILPQNSFEFLRADVPTDIAPTAVAAFIMDKARASLGIDMESAYSSYIMRPTDTINKVSFYAMSKSSVDGFSETLSLLGYKLVSIIPETLAIFKLFDKTLRSGKLETVLYASYHKDRVEGYLYDSSGLISSDKWSKSISDEVKVEQALKSYVEDLAGQGIKLNRVILSGEASEGVRQDLFTKDIGAWTNPLKRIIPTFYEEYVKMLVVAPEKPFPILSFDVCFGAFLFCSENKEFQLLKKGSVAYKQSASVPYGQSSSRKLPALPKSLLLFLVAFLITGGAVFGLMRSGVLSGASLSLPSLSQPTPTPTIAVTPQPTATPTPAFKKEEVKIKILNGSGTPGLAADAKTVLLDAGYEEILTGNASTFDFDVTEIEVKEEFAQAADEIKAAMKDAVDDNTKITITTLDEDDTSDVIVTLGKDFK